MILATYTYEPNLMRKILSNNENMYLKQMIVHKKSRKSEIPRHIWTDPQKAAVVDAMMTAELPER